MAATASATQATTTTTATTPAGRTTQVIPEPTTQTPRTTPRGTTTATPSTPITPTPAGTGALGTEYYGTHVPAGLPHLIARAANARRMTPGEFLAFAVSLATSREMRPNPYRIDSSLLQDALIAPALQNA